MAALLRQYVAKTSLLRFEGSLRSRSCGFAAQSQWQWRPSFFIQSSQSKQLRAFRYFRKDFQPPGKLRVPAQLQPAARKWSQLVNQFSQRWRYYSFGRFSGGGGYARPDVALWMLIGANVSVFFLWKVLDPQFMMANFTVSVHNIMSGRLHTVFTNFFSHNEIWHLASNMLGLYFFGMEIAYRFGSRKLYILYFAGGLASSLGHVVYSYYIFPMLKGYRHSTFVARFVPPALGASGAVNALVVLNIMLNPTRVIFIDFLFPVPAALFGAYLILKDLWGVRDVDSSISHVGHLGGALVGAAAWMKWRRLW